VSISFEENVAQLEAYMANARKGAQAVANAMAEYIADRVANDTLTRRVNPPGTYYKARPGEPPSYGSGALADSMHSTPATEGLRSSASAGSTDRRAPVFEFGSCLLRPTRYKHMGWKDSGGIWRHRSVLVDEHPFLGPTTDDAIDDGELFRVAIEAAVPFDP
jgi:hypothetical protein